MIIIYGKSLSAVKIPSELSALRFATLENKEMGKSVVKWYNRIIIVDQSFLPYISAAVVYLTRYLPNAKSL